MSQILNLSANLPCSRVDREALARRLVGAIADPEIPVLSLDDLGIIRGLTCAADGRIVVTVTPTYTACPATEFIGREIIRSLRAAGFKEVEVKWQQHPPWTTDWISAAGRARMLHYGISPPPTSAQPTPDLDQFSPLCPRCGSTDTRIRSEFGSTPCKIHCQCNVCREPFDYFKCLRLPAVDASRASAQ